MVPRVGEGGFLIDFEIPAEVQLGESDLPPLLDDLGVPDLLDIVDSSKGRHLKSFL
jgi:hypothetical protein